MDPDALDDRIAGMDHDDLAAKDPQPAAPHPRPLIEALSYPPLCAHGMSPFADRQLPPRSRTAAQRLTVKRQTPNAKRPTASHQSKGTAMSLYVYRRLMRDKLARLRRAGAPHE